MMDHRRRLVNNTVGKPKNGYSEKETLSNMIAEIRYKIKIKCKLFKKSSHKCVKRLLKTIKQTKTVYNINPFETRIFNSGKIRP